MEISFLRHADAENYATNDFERQLTSKGINDLYKLALVLKKAEECYDIIITSPLIRAVQTASTIADKLGLSDNIVQEENMACGATFLQVKTILKEYNQFKQILFVGHAPDMGYITQQFLNTQNNIKFKKASILKLETTFIREGSASLKYFINPALI